MNDSEIMSAISKLADEEHALLKSGEHGGGLSADEQARLKQLEVTLDQCWDLLRQRRARREFGQNPDDAQVRDADTVERYKA